MSFEDAGHQITPFWETVTFETVVSRYRAKTVTCETVVFGYGANGSWEPGRSMICQTVIRISNYFGDDPVQFYFVLYFSTPVSRTTLWVVRGLCAATLRKVTLSIQYSIYIYIYITEETDRSLAVRK